MHQQRQPEQDRIEGVEVEPEILDRKFSVQSVGVGLPGMRERLRLLGGKLEIRSDGKGTVLKATVPLNEAKI